MAVVSGLLVATSRKVERPPIPIMVILDNFAPPDLPHKAPADTVTRPVVPARLTKPEKPKMTKQVFQPAAPQVPAATPVPEQSPAKDLPKASTEVPAVLNSRPRVEAANPAPPYQAKIPVQQPAPTAEERPTPEKAQQRYLKEHFAYIRELITKQLVYPSMARKMRWSGKVVVAFVIAEDGNVLNIRVVETSGFPILDK
ncbi:MAG: TonB family protein, partial [Verrucomicrobia bacterium]|nr:TonB family protein [Deltaproteobacteria bacterium]